MANNSRLLTAEVGQPLGYEHFQIHPRDVPAFEKLGKVIPHPNIAVSKIELLSVGVEGDIMDWFLANWTQSIVYSIIYVILVFGGQRIMRNRERFVLRTPLIMWSGMLAIYSTAAALRTFTEMFHILKNHGFYYSICHPICYYGVSGFWALLFALSKVVELGDTAFIVLRKQPLIFLHWYHHITVLCYSWMTYANHGAPARCFSFMNQIVHAFMYSYYTLRAMRYKIPRSCMMGITVLQLIQMIVGVFVTVYAYRMKAIGKYCHVSEDNTFWAFAMYLSYFILFLNFFIQAYVIKPRQEVASTKSVNGATKYTTKKNL